MMRLCQPCFGSPVLAKGFAQAFSLRGQGATVRSGAPLKLSRAPTQGNVRCSVRTQSSYGERGQLGEERNRSRSQTSPFKAKQSLAQNFLTDRNMIEKIVRSFEESFQKLSPNGSVIEIGAGTGALTGLLLKRHPDMLAVEIDQRAVAFLQQAYPALDVLHEDVLKLDWEKLGQERTEPLAVIGNLPYNIVSQILFSMLEARNGSLSFALVMMQQEVAERICAKTCTKAYGILSVVSQLYARPYSLFTVPSTVFSPKPDVTSTMMRFEFVPDPCLDVNDARLTSALRTVIRSSFQQRRKTLRNSLRQVCQAQGVSLPEEWAGKRPEEVTPPEFVRLTKLLFAESLTHDVSESNYTGSSSPVWRPKRQG